MRLADLCEAVARHGQAVLVLVTTTEGSTPREAGAAMLVTVAGCALGTVGGGTVEHRAIEIARAMLAGAAEPRAEVEFPLGPALDQCCGGRMGLAFALLTSEGLGRLEAEDSTRPGRAFPPRGGGAERGRAAGAALELWPGGPVWRQPAAPRQAIVYGAGHVGRALVAALAPLPFRLAWVDARQGACAGAPSGVEVHETPLPEALAEGAEPGALHLVLTHSHALDLEIVGAVMARDFGFCGLIGSATKRATFRRRLSERGLAPAAIDRLTCPVGLPGLSDKRPAVIAASIAAQLLQVDAALAARQPSAVAG